MATTQSPTTKTPSRTLPLVAVHGGPYQRGVQHGRQCGDLIARYPDVLLQAIHTEAAWRALPIDRSPTREALIKRGLTFLPQYEAFAPHLVEEMRGIADGARLPFADVLLVNVRAEVMGVKPDALTNGASDPAPAPLDACTAFALGRSATANGEILAGQNLDQDPANAELFVMLSVEPDEGSAMLMCSFAGLVGYHGINETGVAFFQNAMSTAVWRQTGMPHYLLKRVLLEQTSLAGCVDVLREAHLCSSTNYVLADREAVLDVEATPDGIATVAPVDDVVTHANHFHDPTFAQEDALLAKLPDSACRADRLAALIRRSPSRPDARAMMAMLADHARYPESICRHEAGLASIASLVAEPDQGRLHVAVGNPCRHEFVAYSL